MPETTETIRRRPRHSAPQREMPPPRARRGASQPRQQIRRKESCEFHCRGPRTRSYRASLPAIYLNRNRNLLLQSVAPRYALAMLPRRSITVVGQLYAAFAAVSSQLAAPQLGRDDDFTVLAPTCALVGAAYA